MTLEDIEKKIAALSREVAACHSTVRTATPRWMHGWIPVWLYP